MELYSSNEIGEYFMNWTRKEEHINWNENPTQFGDGGGGGGGRGGGEWEWVKAMECFMS